MSMNGVAGHLDGRSADTRRGKLRKHIAPQLLPLRAKPPRPPSLASPRGCPHRHTRPQRPPGGDSRADPRAAPDRTAKPSRSPDSGGHPEGWALHPPRRRRPRGRPARPHSPAPGRPRRRPAGPSHRRTRCPSARHATPPGGPHTHGAHQPDAAALQGRRRGCDILETPGLAGRQGLGAVLQGRDREPLRKQEAG